MKVFRHYKCRACGAAFSVSITVGVSLSMFAYQCTAEPEDMTQIHTCNGEEDDEVLGIADLIKVTKDE